MSLFSKAKSDLKYLRINSAILSDTGKKKKRRAQSIVLGMIISLIFAATILLALARIIPLDIIPNRYLYIGIISIAVIWIICFFTQFSNKKLPGKIVAGALSVVLIFVFLFTSKFAGTLSKISGGSLEQKNVMDVVVLKSDNATSINDTLKYPYAYNSSTDSALTKQTIDRINSDYKSEIYSSTYSTWTDAFTALEDGKDVKAVIIKDSIYESVIKESYSDYYNDTKVVGQITITTTSQPSASDKKVTQEPFVLYISGNDEQGEIKSAGRSDVNIFMVVNPKTRQVLLISTPRDSYITISNEDGYTGKDKLTHAGLAGVEYSELALSTLYDEKIDYYMKINFTGVVKLVDAMGGVTVDSDVAFTNGRDAAPISYNFNVGPNQCDGAKALAFCRERQAFAEGDFQRGRNQMALIRAMINKITSPAILANYAEIMDATTGVVYTNMPTSSLTSLVKSQFSGGGEWNIQTYSAEGTDSTATGQVYGIKGMSVVKLYDYSVKLGRDLTDKIINGDVFNVDEYVEEHKNDYTSTKSTTRSNSYSYSDDDTSYNTVRGNNW